MRFKLWLVAAQLMLAGSLYSQKTASLPSANLYDKAGHTLSTSSLSDFDNPVLVITYSEQWCVPCVNLISDLDRNYSSLGTTSHLKIYAINVEKTRSSFSVFNLASRWSHVEVLHDQDGQFQDALNTRVAPHIFFLDENQQVVFWQKSYNLDVKKAYQLADWIRKKEVKAGHLYFDKDWFPCPSSQALYYRSQQKTADGKWTITDYYKSGKIQMKGQASMLFPLVREGHYQYYYENGQLSSESNFVNDQLDGLTTGYFENGRKSYEYRYKNGKYDGNWTRYYDNGQVYNAGTYSQGKTTGTWYHYYKSGKKLKETNWDNGKREGLCTGWYESGKLKYKVQFKNDILQINQQPKIQYENGQTFFDFWQLGDSIRIRYFYDNGQVMRLIETYGDLIEFSSYYNDGKLSAKATLNDEMKVNGKFIRWYSNGQKSAEATYFNNKPSGRAMAWYENGTPREKVDFTSDQREYYDSTGNKISKPDKVYFNIKSGETLDTDNLLKLVNEAETIIKEDGNS